VLSQVQKVLAAEQGGRDLHWGSPTPVAARVSSASPAPRATRSTVPGPAPRPTPGRRALPRISAFGDSVMLGAREELNRRFPGGTLDAVEGRQPDPILADVDAAQAAGRLNPLVVIGVGDNGLIDPAALRRTLARLAGVPRVVVVNNRVGRDWEAPNNRTIAGVVPQFGNATVLDWHGISAAHPGWFYDDGIHLTPAGAAAYTRLIAAAARGAPRHR
jgi:lysophospholipase L1-like esterase